MGHPTPWRRAAGVLAAACTCALAWSQPAAAQGGLWPWELVSRGSGDAEPSTGYATTGRPSSDGRHVLFESDGDDLHEAKDPGSIRDVYLKDMDTHDLRLVSRVGLAGPGGDDSSHVGAMSADTRYVGFGSHAKNLHALDADRWYDAFVKDMATGDIRLMSPSVAEGRTDGYGGAGPAHVSADGGYAVFVVVDFGGGPNGIYRRDLQSGELELVSQPTGSGWTRSEITGTPAVSADGRYVAFATAQPLVPEDTDNQGIDVYLRDLEEDVTTFVSDPDLVGHAEMPTISADGGRVAYVRQPTGGRRHAYVWDRATGTTEQADRILFTDVRGNDHTDWARISPDGSRLVFMSFATNLGLDLDEYSDVFVRNLETGITENVSFLLPGPGRWHGGSGDITPDNRFVVFGSGDDYLSLEDDDDAASDVYRRRLIRFPPLCIPVVQTVERDTTATVPLPCRDLEGDEMTYEIVTGPRHGELGPIDAASGTVDYTPDPGYVGEDTLTFRASDSSGAGPPAVAALVVHQQVPVETPDPPPAEPAAPVDPPPFAVPDLGLQTPQPAPSDTQPVPAATGAPAPAPACAVPLIGTAAGDLLRGSEAGDLLRGAAGDDRLRAEGGDDCLQGGPGADSIVGGKGNDSLMGGPGADSLLGGAGDDSLDGGPGRDVHRGGSGDDRIQAADGVPERVDCGGGRDRATLDRRDVARGCERVKRRTSARRR